MCRGDARMGAENIGLELRLIVDFDFNGVEISTSNIWLLFTLLAMICVYEYRYIYFEIFFVKKVFAIYFNLNCILFISWIYSFINPNLFSILCCASAS
jgi:hypothetical protein